MAENEGAAPANPETPGQGITPARQLRASAGLRIALMAVFGVLVAAVIGVVWVLPDFVDRPELDTADVRPTRPEPPPPSAAQTELARHKREAERTLQAFLHRQAALEGQAVAAWGGEDYDQVLQTLAEADAAFGNGAFQSAGAGYEAATNLLNELEASKPQRLQEALTQGRAALERYDAEAAKRYHQTALALDPGNEQALAGAARAETLDQVAQLLGRAGEFERNGDWTAARQEYEDAVRLDPDAPEAQQGLSRTIAELDAQRFRRLMSDSLAAMEKQDFDAARRALSEADALRPGSGEVADARQRLQTGIHRQRIEALRKKAESLTQAERWHEASREFEAALDIDAQAQFAVHGLAESRRMAQMHEQLDRYLGSPERLQSPEPQANARKLLDASRALDAVGPRLAQKLGQLERALELAQTPVKVVLRSDEMTDVSINRVGRLGRFKESVVTLTPGTYVVRGTRSGYRDVRLQLTVAAGASDAVLRVQCEEKI